MKINYANANILEKYVEDNIVEINNQISQFKKKNTAGAIYDETDIKNYLSAKLYNELPSINNKLLEELEKVEYKKSKIKDIANSYVYYAPDLERVYETLLFAKLSNTLKDGTGEKVADVLFENSDLNAGEKKFLSKSLKKISTKSLDVLLMGGFLVNINDTEAGVMTANAGDSAQFLFLARAILAGFNASNVDVRASRYDSIVDYKNKLFKVQVKGISGTTISFKDRDRGGKGIDTANPRNQGKRITSRDCDVYAAVDKQVGICYLIPMKHIDPLKDDEIKSINVSNLLKYKENWDVFDELL